MTSSPSHKHKHRHTHKLCGAHSNRSLIVQCSQPERVDWNNGKEKNYWEKRKLALMKEEGQTDKGGTRQVS